MPTNPVQAALDFLTIEALSWLRSCSLPAFEAGNTWKELCENCAIT